MMCEVDYFFINYLNKDELLFRMNVTVVISSADIHTYIYIFS